MMIEPGLRSIVVFIVVSDEFLRGANYRHFDSMSSKAFLNSLPVMGVGNVLAMPGEQKVHAMNPGACDVEGVIAGALRPPLRP